MAGRTRETHAPLPAALAESAPAAPLRALRAATAFYLLLPSLLFAYGWLRPVLAVPVLALVAVCLAATGRESWQAARVGWSALRAQPGALRRGLASVAPAAVVLLAWLLLSGAGGLGYQNDDYHASNALLKQLIQSAWPPTFEYEGQSVPIVYYVGYFLPAAVVGKVLGWRAANLALWGWTAAGCGLAFAWFAVLSGAALRGRAARLLGLAMLFCLAGGLDLVAVFARNGAPPGLTEHIEFWAGYFQYSSNTTLLYWVPQQAVAAWLLTSLVLDALYHPHDLRDLGLSLAAGLLWSPLALLGLLPYCLLLGGVYITVERRALPAATWLANLAAVPLAGVLGLYLSANRYRFPAGWVWLGGADARLVAAAYVQFWIFEIGCLGLALVVTRMTRRVSPDEQRGIESTQTFRVLLLATSLVTLTLLPLYRLGYNNDLAMRASIPSLFVLWLWVGQALLAGCDGLRRGAASRLARVAYGVLVVVVVVGFWPSAAEVGRSLARYHFGPPHWDDVVSMSAADRPHLVMQRAGDGDALFFRDLARQPPR